MVINWIDNYTHVLTGDLEVFPQVIKNGIRCVCPTVTTLLEKYTLTAMQTSTIR